jgi:hypothetical protein
MDLALAGQRGNPGVALVRHRFRVRGVVRPFSFGQRITVRFQRGRRLLKSVTVTVHSARHAKGLFFADFSRSSAGRITVTAQSVGPPLAGLAARPLNVDVIPGRARPGSRGPAVRFLQHRLAALRYALSLSGVFDASTGRAVLAFRKLTRMRRTSTADSRVFLALARGQGAFHVRYRRHGKHVEADLSHQVLAEIDPGGHVRRIYEMSSGKPSTPTVVGHFRVYSKTPGTNAKGMVDSNYFISGYAIHGYADVPPSAASHGCLRVPIPDAGPIFRWLRTGDRVDVYARGRRGSRHLRNDAGP